jgi:tetratricopeptide (TPR) repeat protein
MPSSSDAVDTPVSFRPNSTGEQQDWQLAAQLLLGLMTEGNYALAASRGEALAEQYPDVIPVLVMAAQAQLLFSRVERAQEFADYAMAVDRNLIPVLVLQSRIALVREDREQALKFIEEAIVLEPENSGLYQEKGDIFSVSAEIDEAKKAYLLSLEIDERNATSLLSYSLLTDGEIPITLVKKYRFFLSSKQLPSENQARAHFALSNFYKTAGDMTLFARHLSLGNEILQKKYQFDPVQSKAESEAIIRYFSPHFLATKGISSRVSSARIIFIVGMPRSGSTLIEQILAKHSQVTPTGESSGLTNALNHLSLELPVGNRFPVMLDDIGNDGFGEIVNFYLDRIPAVDDAEYITDKTLVNYQFIGLIHLLFPNAKIIHVKRGAAATCYSCYRRLFAPACVTYSYSLDHLAAVYRDYLSVMSHWQQTLPGKIHTMQYEELVQDPQKTTQSLLKHCELQWEPECLEFYESDRTIFTASNTAVKQPLYRSALDSWTDFRDHLGPVLELEE